jgi:hypothetical protein
MNDFVNLLEHSDLTRSVWPGNPDPLIVVFIIVLAFAVGMFIGFVYMWTHDALSYSRSFVSALAVMPLIVAMLMLSMAGNIFVAFRPCWAFSVSCVSATCSKTRAIPFLSFGRSWRVSPWAPLGFPPRHGCLGHCRRFSLPPVHILWHAAAL